MKRLLLISIVLAGCGKPVPQAEPPLSEWAQHPARGLPYVVQYLANTQ